MNLNPERTPIEELDHGQWCHAYGWVVLHPERGCTCGAEEWEQKRWEMVRDATRYRTLRSFPETTVFVRRNEGPSTATICERPGEGLDRLLDRFKSESHKDSSNA